MPPTTPEIFKSNIVSKLGEIPTVKMVNFLIDRSPVSVIATPVEKPIEKHPFKICQIVTLTSFGKDCSGIVCKIDDDLVQFLIADSFLEHKGLLTVRRYPDGYRTVAGDHEVRVIPSI